MCVNEHAKVGSGREVGLPRKPAAPALKDTGGTSRAETLGAADAKDTAGKALGVVSPVQDAALRSFSQLLVKGAASGRDMSQITPTLDKLAEMGGLKKAPAEQTGHLGGKAEMNVPAVAKPAAATARAEIVPLKALASAATPDQTRISVRRMVGAGAETMNKAKISEIFARAKREANDYQGTAMKQQKREWAYKITWELVQELPGLQLLPADINFDNRQKLYRAVFAELCNVLGTSEAKNRAPSFLQDA